MSDRDDDPLEYSLLQKDEYEEAHPPAQVRVSRTPGATNMFAGRLRGSQRVIFLTVLSVFLLVILWLLSTMENTSATQETSLPSMVRQTPQMEPDASRRPSDIRTLPELHYDWFRTTCYGEKEEKLSRSIGDIFRKVQLLKESHVYECNLMWTIFNNILRMDSISAGIFLPIPFQSEVRRWLDNNEKLFEQVNNQTIYKIVNKGTYEETIFNPIRAKRPVSKPPMDPLDYIKNLTESTAPNCDFCKYKDHTAADTFGRIDNKYSASSSNTFKLAKFHGLFFPKQHHPLNLSLIQLQDLFLNTSKEWFEKAHENDPEQKYPSLMWDTLPHAGASQVHPHVHGVLDANQYVGGFESWHQVSIKYFNEFKRSYWSDFVKLHSALGLGISSGEAVAIVPLTARKDHEYMILSPTLNEDVVNFIYNVMQAYQQRLGVYCFSCGAVYPKLDSGNLNDTGMPVIFRIGSRGTCTSVGSDVSSLELYTINNINSDLAKTYDGLSKQISSKVL